MEADMSSNMLKEKSEALSDRIIACAKVLQERKAPSSIINQLFRAGTSVGANVAEAQFAQSKKDFISKFEIALKETNETIYWLERIFKSEHLTEREFKSMRSDCIAIKKLLIASITTIKTKLNSEKTKQ
jgi:four helix bundle protein